MADLAISTPYPMFFDLDGQPLESGYIYIGELSLNPINNPITVYFDKAGTITAAQPLRTLAGFIINNGTPANIYLDDPYSIVVQNKNGVTVFNGDVYGGLFSGADISLTGDVTAANVTASGNVTCDNLIATSDVSGDTATIAGTITAGGNITAPRFISTIATGTAPFSVASTTQVNNLNTQLMGGFGLWSSGNNWGVIPYTASGGGLYIGSTIFFRTDDTTTSGPSIVASEDTTYYDLKLFNTRLFDLNSTIIIDRTSGSRVKVIECNSSNVSLGATGTDVFTTASLQTSVNAANSVALNCPNVGVTLYDTGTDRFVPDPDNGLSLGSSTARWTAVYAVNGTIQTSDEREKNEITDIYDVVLDAWEMVEFKMYRYNHEVEDEGENAKLHFGVLAQQIETAFASVGLDALDYGVIYHDSWDDDPENDIKAGDRYSVRMDECMVLEAALNRRRLKRLEERLL